MAILTTTNQGLNFIGGTTFIQTGTTTLMAIATNGDIQFSQYGAGTLVSDASGNITVSSGGGAGGPYLPLSAGTSFPLTGRLESNSFIHTGVGTTPNQSGVLLNPNGSIVVSSSNLDLIEIDSNNNRIRAFTGSSGQGNLNFPVTGGTTYEWTLPLATGTIALTGDLGSYLPLAGGTMTGPITTPNLLKFTGTGAGQGIQFNSATVANDAFGIRVNGTSNVGELEFFSTDDDDEPFVWRHYTSGQGGTGASVEWFRIGASGNTTAAGSSTAASFLLSGGGSLTHGAFWGTTINAGAGSYSDFAVLNSATNGLMHNPTGTLNMNFAGTVSAPTLNVNSVDQNNVNRFGNIRSEVGFTRSPNGTDDLEWFKVVNLNGSPKRLKFSIISTGDNTNSYDNFLISTSGYGMNMHIEKLPGGRYNTSKLLSVAVINPSNGGGVEIWIKLLPIYSGTGVTYVACTSDVLASATILASATTTAPTITNNDTQLDISGDNRNYATIQTSRGATFKAKVGIGTNAPAAMLTVAGDSTISGNVGIGTTSTSYALDVDAGGTGALLGDSATAAIFRAGRQNVWFQNQRTAAGNDWNNNTFKIIAKIDTTSHQSINFVNDNSFNEHIDIYTGNQVFNTRFNANGNVGIGTTVPAQSNLVVSPSAQSANVDGVAVVYNPDGATNRVRAQLKIDNFNGVLELTNNADIISTYITAAGGDSYFNGGKVGIGTTGPGAKLHVVGETYFQLNTGAGESTTWKNATEGGVIQLGFQINGTDGMHHRSFVRSKIDPNGTYGGQLQFLVRQHSTANQLEVMTLRSNGYVGIGTNAPGQKLTVDGRTLIQNTTTPFYIKVNSTYKSWVHHVASDDTYVMAPSTADGGETWDWANQTSFSTSGVVTAKNFVLSSDKRNKTKIKDLTGDNVDISWKSFEMKGDQGEYRAGVIAQELEENHPEFVNTDDRGFKSVKYIDLLIAKIAELEARLEILEK